MREGTAKRTVVGLARASHFGPTVLVTSLSYFFAQLFWHPGSALVIALGVFCGQLVVGWSNDLIDYRDDLSHNRQIKPLVAGLIRAEILKRCMWVSLTAAFVINLFGPLGVKGGWLSLLAIACAVGYNFYFKFTVFSWLPFAIAFAALPSCMTLSKDIAPPMWMWLGGALLGSAAHFLNVIKDMKEDHISGIKGLPQLCGTKLSVVIAIALFLAALIQAFYAGFELPQLH
jgi:4-hydroxybenzoate polyprenyltransferase